MTNAQFSGFPKEGLGFLRELAANNEKGWFDEHRAVYERALLEPAKAFVEALGRRLKKLSPGIKAEPRVNGSIMRINRDVRFSKDKSPYKTHFDLWFWEAAERTFCCSGFYFRLTPKALMLGVGMLQFDKERLAGYRQAVLDPKRGPALERAIQQVEAEGFEVGGKNYRKVPRGLPADHPRGELLKHDGLYAGAEASVPAQLHTSALVDYCYERFEGMVPLHRWLSGLVRG